jgi:hypothetical protein
LLSKARLPVTNITVTERTVNILVYWKNQFSMSYIGLNVHGVANSDAFAGVLTVADVPAAASLKLAASFKVLSLSFPPVLALSPFYRCLC